MTQYSIRPATLADIDALVQHRLDMFTEMGTLIDRAAVDASFRQWLAEAIPSGTYQAWVAEAVEVHDIVAGGGITILPWPPGPRWLGGRVAFVFNVYTQPRHRLRGLARSIMRRIHDWCRANEIHIVGLTASSAGEPLYASLGYQAATARTLWVQLE
jgi:GNAT superfamily N-acetyltransferase